MITSNYIKLHYVELHQLGSLQQVTLEYLLPAFSVFFKRLLLWWGFFRFSESSFRDMLFLNVWNNWVLMTPRCTLGQLTKENLPLRWKINFWDPKVAILLDFGNAQKKYKILGNRKNPKYQKSSSGHEIWLKKCGNIQD